MQIQRQTRRLLWDDKAEIGEARLQVKVANKPEEARKNPPAGYKGYMSLLTPWCWASSLKKHEAINFYRFRPRRLCYFVLEKRIQNLTKYLVLNPFSSLCIYLKHNWSLLYSLAHQRSLPSSPPRPTTSIGRGGHVSTQWDGGHLQVKENLRMKPNLPAPCSWTSQPLELWDVNFCCWSHLGCSILLW